MEGRTIKTNSSCLIYNGFQGKRPELEAKDSSPLNGMVKIVCTSTSTPAYAFIQCTVIVSILRALVQKGSITLEKLEAMTCVCSVGLDMIAIPGSTSAETISGIIADEMAIGMVNNKTTAVRLIPVPGKTVGEWAEFGGLLGGAPVMAVNTFSCADFIARGGRIPAPIHSFRN
jgi:hypothetical protein